MDESLGIFNLEAHEEAIAMIGMVTPIALSFRRVAPSLELETALRQIRRVQSMIQGYMRYVQRRIDRKAS